MTVGIGCIFPGKAGRVLAAREVIAASRQHAQADQLAPELIPQRDPSRRRGVLLEADPLDRVARAFSDAGGGVAVGFLVPIWPEAAGSGRGRLLRLSCIARRLGARAFPGGLISPARGVLRGAAFDACPPLGLSLPLSVAGRLECDGRSSMPAAEKDGFDRADVGRVTEPSRIRACRLGGEAWT